MKKLPLNVKLKLRAALPDAGSVVDKESEMAVYECDGLTMFKRLPMAVVLPSSIAEVRSVARICRRHKIPVVARGAGTGLSGGALPVKEGIMLNLARMNRILSIDATRMQARVQPGVINLEISSAAAAHGLYYAPDPSSQSACSIGGNIAENAGGVHCLKYGLTVNNVLQIKVVTIDGELMEFGNAAYDSCGYDFLALLNGSEGLLGFIVEAVVKLLPRPPANEVMLAAFGNIDDAAKSVAQIISAGIIPAGLEMMDNPAIRAAESFIAAGYPTTAQAILICEVDGHSLEVKSDTERLRAIFSQNNATQMIIAKDEKHKQKLWAGRKAAFPAVGKISPDYYCMDGTIPRRCLAETLKTISDLSQKHGLAVANVFHAGDGNLHPLILYDANDSNAAKRAEDFGNDILAACIKAGGTVTGEHGVGVEKLDAMCGQFNTAELEQFYRLKAAFDPDSLLNPGKGIPTLRRCAEFGRMHVHHGKLPHPNLPRF